MDSPFAPVAPCDDFWKDELLRLELKVARRADELSQIEPTGPETDWDHWIRAEREVLGSDFEPASAS